jgi:transposase-like protein
VVDGLWAYEKGFKKVFYSRYKEHRVEFVKRAGIRARETNNVVERLHGTLKDRLKPLRGLKMGKRQRYG